MNPRIDLDRCLTFINCQLQPPRGQWEAQRAGQQWRAVTISRQSGSGAHVVAEKLAEALTSREPADACPWTVLDRNLVEKVLEEHHLPKRWARFMAEDKISEITDTMDELFGLHPPSWTLVRDTAETILHLADVGRVILIGRGANVITGRLEYVFHVRLVGSLEKRLEYLQRVNEISRKKAIALAAQEDHGRKRYLRKYFGKDIDDPLLYHLTINTDLVPYEEAACLIADAVLPRRVKAW